MIIIPLKYNNGGWNTLHACLARLWKGTDDTTKFEHINRLEPELLYAVLPQCLLCILLAHHTPAESSNMVRTPKMQPHC